MSDKIRPQHVGRKAILYVRQSSAYQVNHNVESQRLQYAMQGRLQQLGWRDIDVVDEDLVAPPSGRSRVRGKCRDLRGIAASGSTWSRSVAWSIPC